jgi:O-antigen/teichoic acid export membrane protein
MTASATDPRESVAAARELRPGRPSSEWLPAIGNALKLGSSLVLTLLIAIAMRFLMPRYLGPTRFGTLSFADGFTATSFVVLSLGAEFYIRKEVSVRPAHASDFFGGTVVLRVAMAALIFGIMALVMRATGRPPEVRNLVYLFGVAQFFVGLNATLSALLHARGQVGGMSVLAVATKVIWAAGVVAAIAWGTGLWGFAGAYLASESVETVVLFALARRHLDLVCRVDVPATKAMIVSCLPYFVNACASNAYNRLDVTVLGMMTVGREVGWYVAASSITGLTLLITPLIDWVLTPVFARGAVHSRERLYENIRDATEPILTVAIPAALFVSVGADVWLRLLFGHAFAPAALALRILAASSVVIYVAIVYAMTLIMMQRAWTLALISVAGLVVNLLLNLLLIPAFTTLVGDGGGGVGCAVAALGTHVFAAVAMVAFVGRGAISARTVRMVGKSLVACALVVLVDRLAAGIGGARIGVDVVVYLAVVVTTGALRPLELYRVAADAVRSRRLGRAADPGEPCVGQRA